MSEERLQEIKDSISLQYKVQEANDLNKFNIFTDEEQELVDEIEKLKQRLEIEIDISDGMLKTIDRAKELMNEYRYTKVEEYWKIIEFFKKLENILKGSDKK